MTLYIVENIRNNFFALCFFVRLLLIILSIK